MWRTLPFASKLTFSRAPTEGGDLMHEIFSQLAGLLAHLGEKPILVIPVLGAEIRVDWMTILMSWIVMALIVVVAVLLRRGLRQPVEEKPNRVQATLDALIDLLHSQLSANFSSEDLARKMFPFVSTLFLYVLVSNWLGVVPYLDSPTRDLNVTLGLALLVLFLSHTLAVRRKGIKRYLRGFIEPYPFMLPMNLVGEVAKPLSHSFRLFGNISAGGILVTVVFVKFAPIIVPPILNLVFGLFFGAIQAFVFAILAVAYINVAVES
ncbi:ATP synthase F0 subunit A [Candidatus Acetothermia bacterium]|nr:MAG: ATP synthase F0 subunit A [Candidatus Acetothermia bacterium]